MRHAPSSTTLIPLKPSQPGRSDPKQQGERNDPLWTLLAPALTAQGLDTLAGVRQFRGEVIKNHNGTRDVLRIRAIDPKGCPHTLYLKRTWQPYKKDGLLSLFQHRRVWSISRREWENSRALAAAGLTTAGLVAYGEDCGLLWENFSYILTAEATGTQTLQQFLKHCHDPARRRRVLDALATVIRTMHDAGLASPDLFTRHIFVDERPDTPAFCLIDMARLDQRTTLSDLLRARDLAALNITAPLRYVSRSERLRFLNLYAPARAEALRPLILSRMNHLLRRRKFRDFALPPERPLPRTTFPEIATTRDRVQP